MRAACLALVTTCACASVAPNRLRDGQRDTDGDVTEIGLRGMTILVKSLPHEPLVSCELYVRGGVRNWTAAEAGVEKLALATAVSGGTDSLPKAAFQARLAGLGTQLGADSGDDYAVLGLKALDRNFPASFALLADAFLHPVLPGGEVELQRQLLISELRQEDENPDSATGKALHGLLYQGLPYARRAAGTVEIVEKLSRARLVAHLAKLRETSRLLLVVVGNVDPAEVAALAQKAFAAVPVGDYREAALAPPVFSAPRVELIDRPLPTHYVLAAFPAPTWNDPDVAVGVVAMSALREKLFEEVRTKRELSYAPSAGLSLHGLGEGYLYVTAVEVEKTLRVMQDVVHAYQAGQIDPVHLQGDERIFLTNLLLQNESTSGQAELLARSEIVGGNWRLARDLPAKVQAVQPAQVAAFLREHLRNLQLVVLGRAQGLTAAPLAAF